MMKKLLVIFLFSITVCTSCVLSNGETPTGVGPALPIINSSTATQQPPTAFLTNTPVPQTPTPTRTNTQVDTPTAVPSATPTIQPLSVSYPFKLAKAFYESATDQGVWVYDSTNQATAIVSNIAMDEFSWSHDGQSLGGVRRSRDGQFTIIVVDLQNNTYDKYPLSNVPILTNYYHYGALQWSLNDRWLSFVLWDYENDGNERVVKTWIVDTDTKKTIQPPNGIFFSSWSGMVEDEYLYVLWDIPARAMKGSTKFSVHIGKIGQNTPIYSFADMGALTPRRGHDIEWSPNGELAISYGDDGTSQVIRLFFETNTWEVVSQRGSYVTPALWSPNSRYVILRGWSTYLWEVAATDKPYEQTLPENARPMIWTPDSQYLLYYDDQLLYALNPNFPTSPMFFYDLTELNLTPDYHFKIWWMPSESPQYP